jgi:hypothetical protein
MRTRRRDVPTRPIGWMGFPSVGEPPTRLPGLRQCPTCAESVHRDAPGPPTRRPGRLTASVEWVASNGYPYVGGSPRQCVLVSPTPIP